MRTTPKTVNPMVTTPCLRTKQRIPNTRVIIAEIRFEVFFIAFSFVVLVFLFYHFFIQFVNSKIKIYHASAIYLPARISDIYVISRRQSHHRIAVRGKRDPLDIEVA